MQRRDDFIVRLCGGCGQLTEQCECRWTTRMGKLPKLTSMQEQVLDLIVQWQKAGITPSLAEMAESFGLKGRNSIKVHTDALVAKGYITKPPTLGRAITVLALPE